MRDIVLRKTNEPENGQKPHIEHDLGLLGPNSGCLFFFQRSGLVSQSLDTMVSYHHVQYQKKLMIQS